MRSVRVEVKQSDIDQGKPCSPWYCPIALAVKRASGFQAVQIGSFYIRINEAEYNLPASARKFIREFDTDLGGEPFTFTTSLLK